MCALECIQGVYNFSSQLPREQDLVALGEGSSNIFFISVDRQRPERRALSSASLRASSRGSRRGVQFFYLGRQAAAGARGPLVSIAESRPLWLSAKGPIFFNLGRHASARAWGPLISFAESRPSWPSAKGPICFLIKFNRLRPERGARSSASPRAGPGGSQ
jgi:hypothetical protein